MSIRIETDDFDKEYTLSDLLSTKTLRELFDVKRVPGIDIKITWPDGRLYFETDQNTSFKGKGTEIRHDAETIALLFVNIKPEENCAILPHILTAVIEKLMFFQQKILMTSGLHGRIVESSYDELMGTNIKLKASEEKYRNLAENLEIEVKKKTEAIKKTLTILMQREKLASVGSLAAGMAHEINNPLGFIISNTKILGDYIEELAGEKKLSEMDIIHIRDDSKALIEETREGLNRIKKIVSDLKCFSAIDSPDMTYTDINACIESCLGIIENLTSDRIKITKMLNTLPKTSIDAGKINQMFLAILMNSVQAIQGNGSINIETDLLIRKKEYVRIEIKDTGCGISPENITRVFDPFFTTKEVGKGMGLGLTTARETARIHHGDILIKNRPEGGAVCTIIIPVKE